jgi:hypothetical protein
METFVARCNEMTESDSGERSVAMDQRKVCQSSIHWAVAKADYSDKIVCPAS